MLGAASAAALHAQGSVNERAVGNLVCQKQLDVPGKSEFENKEEKGTLITILDVLIICDRTRI